MKLLRWGDAGVEKPGVVATDGTVRDLSDKIDDIGPETLTPRQIDRLRGIDAGGLPNIPDGVRIGPCVSSAPNFHAIGLNYTDHAKEAGQDPPTEPILFSKATSCICGPNDNVIRPPGSTKLDHEVELGIVIGSRAHLVNEASATDHVAGYCLMNDISERAFQIEGTGQWIKGKSAPTFGPIGPWLVTTDEIPDPQTLDMWLDVNGDRRQTGNTRAMIFSVAEIVSYMSRHMALLPGDLIATGTPPGVAMGMNPPEYLKPGDEIRLGISGLGEQRLMVTAP